MISSVALLQPSLFILLPRELLPFWVTVSISINPRVYDLPGSPMIITVVAQLVHLGVKCCVKVTYDNLVILIALKLRPT